MHKKIVLILIAIIFVSCHASKSVIGTTKNTQSTSTKKRSYSKSSSTQKTRERTAETIESTSKTTVTNDVVKNYILNYKDIAMENMKTYGIPASITLAQGILESGAGRGDLAMSANNHFGIKCHNDWKGDFVRHDDDAAQECFRKYDTPEESYRDHSLFLKGKRRYETLFTYKKDDYKSWAKELRKAGYATDPKYPSKLMSYIERYQLDQYDAQVLGKKYKIEESQSTNENGISKSGNLNYSYYEVKKGDTLYSISKKFNVLIEDLKRNNNLYDNTISIGQKLILK